MTDLQFLIIVIHKRRNGPHEHALVFKVPILNYTGQMCPENNNNIASKNKIQTDINDNKSS